MASVSIINNNNNQNEQPEGKLREEEEEGNYMFEGIDLRRHIEQNLSYDRLANIIQMRWDELNEHKDVVVGNNNNTNYIR